MLFIKNFQIYVVQTLVLGKLCYVKHPQVLLYQYLPHCQLRKGEHFTLSHGLGWSPGGVHLHSRRTPSRVHTESTQSPSRFFEESTGVYQESTQSSNGV